ncbi:F-box only protein 31-like [Anneissia japonica]|uniref:F-box only protein 31-like n=1 Tax=Anneissia japonica TaxID=1529436 RepID=UPI001425BB60|nr:F-box only protein 31-like [Anneissia japonica]
MLLHGGIVNMDDFKHNKYCDGSEILNIQTFPLELLAHVFKLLSGSDLASVAQVCKRFYEVSNVETVWQTLCLREYKFTSEDFNTWNTSYKIIYTKVLRKYGNLIGTWQPKINPYGGLLSIKFDKGAIIGTQYFAPPDPNVCDPLRKKKVFKITVDDDNITRLLCLKGKPSNVHPFLFTPGGSMDDFSFKCCKPDRHRKGSNKQEELQQWIHEELGIDILPCAVDYRLELLRIQFFINMQFDASCNFRRLHIPTGKEANQPVQPGLYKGTYGGHGIELVMVSYHGNNLHGVKVTGDPNVPADQLSIQAHMNEPMVLNTSDQHSLSELEALSKDNVLLPSDQRKARQPFIVPRDVMDRGMSKVSERIDLTHCIGRYFATGLIAMDGFKNPSRTPSHFIVFNENMFAMLWIELHSISLYCRVEEELM